MGVNPQKHFIVLKYLCLQADYNNKYPNGGWSWAYKSVFQSNNVIPQRIQLGIQMRGNILFIYRYVLLPLGNVEINTPAMGCSLSQSCLKELCVGGEVRELLWDVSCLWRSVMKTKIHMRISQISFLLNDPHPTTRDPNLIGLGAAGVSVFSKLFE